MGWVEKRWLKERYDQGASGYLELHGEEQILKYNLALDILSLGSGDLVADFGCGIGLFLDRVYPRVGEAVGLNLSLEELKRAKDLLGGYAHLVHGDLDMPPFREKGFTYIFSFTVLHHFKGVSKRLLALERYARKGVIVSILRRTDAEKEVRDRVKNIKDIRMIDDRSIKDLLLFLSPNPDRGGGC